MKKTLLFMLIGGAIIFVWGFISFAMPNFHKASAEYTPLQDEVLSAFEKSGLEEGMYYLGQPDPDSVVDGIYKNATHADDGGLAGAPGGLVIGLY